MVAVAAASLAPAAFATKAQALIEEDCTFDLFNLAAQNAFPQKFIEEEWNDDDSDSDSEDAAPFEKFLLDKATAGTTQLIAALFALPTKSSDVGPIAQLPGTSYVLPRAKTPPEPKEDSKWDKFAKEKGIEQKKRSRKEWDEDLGEWTVRYGRDSRHNKDTAWPIMEADKEDVYADPWAAERDKKKARLEKNQIQQTKNLERAGVLEKGSGTRLGKDFAKKRDQTKTQQQLKASYPAGVPVDMSSVKASEVKTNAQRGAASTKRALELTRQSTASMGKFDKVKAGENVKKRSSEQKKDNKASIKSAINEGSEGDRSKKILSAVLSGSEKKLSYKRQGKDMAGGETAYDHDYEDGHNGYRKKKGRAGAGKMKKANKGMLKPKVGPGKK